MPDHGGHRQPYDAKSRRRHTPGRPSATTPANSSELPSSSSELSAPRRDIPPSPSTKEQLAAQAKATAEQALQLAKLAEESARLAQRLHAQALIPDGEESAPAALAETTDDPSFTLREDHTDALVSVRNAAHTDLSTRRPSKQKTPATAGLPGRIAASSHRGERKKRRARAIARQFKSITISTSLHVALLLVLAYVTWTATSEEAIHTVLASFADEEALVEEALPLEEPIEEPGEQQEIPMPEELPPEELPPAPEEPIDELPAEEPPAPAEPVEVAEDVPPTPGPAPATEPAVDLAKVGSRSEAGKALLLEKYGGSVASESAVQRALEWFASRQRQDGSWNFNDVGPCSQPGDNDNAMGATAYVLLCYLGAGQTHQSGRFKNNVRAGLTFLLSHGKRVPAGGDFRGADCREHDNFYVQAPVAMVLSEAYQMTKDRRLGLKPAAQLAVDFLCHAQDPRGGGWRYEPQEPGCTSVTALVAMAVKSAVAAGLTVPPHVLEQVGHFLDSVRSDAELTGRYGYRVAEPNYRSSTTAMALLCRMHLGWKRDHEELQKGVALLDKRGPYDNLYYCYYATQVMRHWGGGEWERWNSVMRDDLVRTQIDQEGPELGSWTPRDRSGPSTAGGRLFITCLATMTLEVYYRYLPLYGLPDDVDVVVERLPEISRDDSTVGTDN